MATIDNIRNSLIDKLLTITNVEFLSALDLLIEKSSMDKDIHPLTEEQKLLLKLSDLDIKNGRLVSQELLDKEDLKWLKEK